MKIDEIDEQILLSLKEEPQSRNELVALCPTQRIGKRRIEKLLKHKFIKRIRQGIYNLDSKGKACVKKLTPVIAVSLNDPRLEALIRKLPTEAHKALFRITLSGIAAKYLLLKHFDNNWPASIIGGSTKGLKTGLAEITCRLIKELNPPKNIYPLQTATAGEFGIRRFRTKGGFDIARSPYFNEPFICLDEWDKALTKAVKTNALFFADGRREFFVEGKKVVNHCYPFITLNTTFEKFGIPDPYIRRSIVVNTDYLKDELKNVDLVTEDIRRLLSSPKAPKISLRSLSPIRTSFSREEFLFMRNLFMENVKEEYKNLVDTKPLEILTLGRLSLLGEEDVKEAIFQTVWDRLECLETMEGAKEHWRDKISRLWLEYKSVEQPQILAKVREAEKREKERKEKVQRKKEEITQLRAEKIEKEDLRFIKERAALISQLRDLRDELPKEKRWQNKCFPLKEQIKSLIDRIERARNFQDLEVYQKTLPKIEHEQRILITEIAQTVAEEAQLKKEEEDRQTVIKRKKIIVKEEYQDLKKLLSSYSQKIGRMSDQNKRFLESVSSHIQRAQDIDTLNSIELTIKENEREIQGWISQLEEERRKQKEKQEKEKELKREEQEHNQKIQAILGEKERILEKSQKNVFESKYLTSQEKAKLDILQKSQKRARPPKEIALFLEEKGLITKVNSFTQLQNGKTVYRAFGGSYFQRFKELLPFEVYWAADGQVYPLNYFKNWDQAKIFIQIRIDQLRDKAVNERKKELSEQWHALDKKEQSLKPPLRYIRTNRRLVQARNYLGEKEDQRLHFKFEDGTVWMLPKGREWTVYTKIDYGGELFRFISEKGSTIVVQTNEGRREISKNQIFCYIYGYEGPEPR